jgi:RNA polymerase sigma factor (sigma-70 family)
MLDGRADAWLEARMTKQQLSGTGHRPVGQARTDAPLVDRAAAAFVAYRGGDRAAFDELVSLVTPLVWHTVRAQGVDASAAEDVVQTIWMRLLHSSTTIRDPQTVVAWLLTAARRESWRVVKRAREDVVRTASLSGPEGEPAVRLPVQRGDVPEEVVFLEEQQRRLWQHVESLSQRCRELVRVIAFADRPDYALIASSLGMPVGSIGPTRGRCLARLRRELASDPQWEGREP